MQGSVDFAASALEQFEASGQPSAQEVRWYTADPAALDQLTPDGEAEQPHDASWTVDPEGKWIMGNHPDSTLSSGSDCVQCY